MDFTLTHVFEELKKREPIFHHPEFGMTRLDLENMTDESFYEIGALGRRYEREEVINTTMERFQNNYFKNDIWQAKDFHCLAIASNNYLFTYTLIQDAQRITRRATIWRYVEGYWKIVYHQGTIIQ